MADWRDLLPKTENSTSPSPTQTPAVTSAPSGIGEQPVSSGPSWRNLLQTNNEDISSIRSLYSNINSDLTTINDYANQTGRKSYDAELNNQYLTKLRNYNKDLTGYIETTSAQGYNKDANAMRNTQNGVNALIQQLEEKEKGNNSEGLGFWETLKNVVSGGFKGTIGNTVEGQRNLYALGQGARDAETNEQIERWTREVERAQRAIEEDTAAYGADSETVQGDRAILENAQRMLDAYNVVPEAQRGAVEETAKLSDEIATSSWRDIQAAKEGKGKIGQIAVDVGTNAVQMAGDVLLGKLLGTGNGMLPMAVRSYGGAVQEARQAGATEQEQAAYGLTKAGIEMVTEKIADGLAGAYGKGTADDIVESVIGKMSSNNAARNALRLGFSALGEGSEELASDLLDPVAKAIYDKGEALKTKYTDPEAWKEAVAQEAYDMLVGSIMGFGGGTVSMATGEYAQSNAELDKANQTAQETAPQTRAPDNELLNTLSQYDNAQIQAINRNNTNNALSQTLADYDNRQLAELRNTQEANARAEIDRQNEAIRAENENIRNQNAQIQEAQAEQRYANEVWDEASERAANATSITQFKKRNADWLKANGYSSADATNLWKSIHNDIDAHTLTEQEELALTYDSKAQFRADLVAQSDGQISYAEAGEIYDSARSKNRWNEEQQAARERTRTANENPLVNAALQEERAELDYPTNPLTRTVQNAQNASQNSPLEQTRAVETNNVSTEATPLATKPRQTASAPRVTENTTNAAENTAQAEPQQTRAKPTSSTNIRYRLNPRTNAEAATKYGILEEGEIPARESYVPAQTADNTKVSRTARTVAEAEAIPEESLGSVYQAVEDGKFDYVSVTLEDVANKARAKIRREGFDTALRNWTAEVRAGKSNEDLIAEGAILLNNIANYDLGGKLYIDTLTDYIMVTHNTAEALAATRLLKRLSPEGKLYGLQKTVDKYNEQLGENGNIKINEELADRFLKEKTDKGRDKIITEIQQDVADQIPTSFRDAFTALRYVNMLGNFKTQGRNILGNTIMMAAAKTKRSHQAVMTAVYNALGGKAEKNTSLFVDKALKKEALADYAEHQSEALGEKKYADVARQNDAELQDKRTIFKWNWKGEAKTKAEQKLRNLADLPMKGLEAYRRATNWAMEQGDVIFSRATYADAMAGYLQAHGVKSFADASEEMLDNARNYAIKEAQEATFRDSNKVSDWATHFDSNWGKAKVLSQGIVPFRKTPANVGVRAVEYSPANALIQAGKAVYNLVKGNPQASSADVINALSKTMTGTELFALGVAGALAGWARGRNDDEDEGNYEKMNGAQDYAVKLPFGEKGYWISLSQLAPMSIPFFMGSEFAEAMQDGGLRGDNIMNILGAVSAPMLEMSMLSGVNDALDNLTKYNGDKALIPQFVLNSAMSYLTQAVSNTLLGQAEQVSEEYRQQSYTDSESALPTGIQKVIGRIAAKTPGWDYQQGDYINAWGEKQSNGGVGERAFNAFINPTYGAEDTTDELDKALYELNDELRELGNNTNIFPDTVSRGMDIDGTKLTESEYERYATERGQLSHDLVEEFTSSPYWKELSAVEKAETIRDLYSYAIDRAEQNIRASRGTIEVGKSSDDNLAVALDNNPEDIAGYLALNKAFSDRAKVNDYAGIDSLLSTVNTHKNEDGTYSDPEVQQMASDKEFSRYLTAYAGGTNAELVGNVIENIAAANSLLPDEDSAAAGPKIRIAFETLARNGADAQDFKNVLESYKKEGISQANLNWLVKNYFPDDPETQAELFNIFRDYQQTNGKWKTPFEKVTKSTEPENLMP